MCHIWTSKYACGCREEITSRMECPVRIAGGSCTFEYFYNAPGCHCASSVVQRVESTGAIQSIIGRRRKVAKAGRALHELEYRILSECFLERCPECWRYHSCLIKDATRTTQIIRGERNAREWIVLQGDRSSIRL